MEANSIVLSRTRFAIDGSLLTPVQIKQFWDLVRRNHGALRDLSADLDDCWLWQGERSADGHGIFTPVFKDGTGATLWAHRVAFSLSTLIQIPTGLCLRHLCGLAPCCNPAHHMPGTSAQNRLDTIAHRAMAASLTPEQVAIIQASNARIHHLARRFQVTNGIVWTLKFGKPGAKSSSRPSTRRIAA